MRQAATGLIATGIKGTSKDDPKLVPACPEIYADNVGQRVEDSVQMRNNFVVEMGSAVHS